jgi:hypothetical protein
MQSCRSAKPFGNGEYHDFVTVHLFLAADAECRPWQRLDSLGRNLFLAALTDAIGTVGDAGESHAYQPPHSRIAVEIANRQLTLSRHLNFIQGVRDLFDRDFFPVAPSAGQFFLLRFKNRLDSLSLNFGHRSSIG